MSTSDTFKEKEKGFRQAFQTSSWDAISGKETYHLIFQTTYPTAPSAMSKNFWMLSSFEGQDGWFGNRWTLPAWTWQLRMRHAILGRWQNAPPLLFRRQPLFSKCSWIWHFLSLHSQQTSQNRVASCRSRGCMTFPLANYTNLSGTRQSLAYKLAAWCLSTHCTRNIGTSFACCCTQIYGV